MPNALKNRFNGCSDPSLNENELVNRTRQMHQLTQEQVSVQRLAVKQLSESNKAGINRIRSHDLRHTYASLLIEQGENIKYIQNQLGHANPTVTLNVYAHLMKETNQAAAKRLQDTIHF